MDSRRPLQLSFGFALLLAVVPLAADLSRPAPAHGATFVVATTEEYLDASLGNGVCQGIYGLPCSLRAAIQEANAHDGADVITLPAGTYNLTNNGANENNSVTGDLDIKSDLTINGAGAATTIIDAGDLDRVFDVLSGTVSISGVTIRNGNTPSAGGGIYNSGTLTLTNSTVSGNGAGPGGGIYNYAGTLTLTNSTVSGNDADADYGGGIYNYAGTLTLTNSTVGGNDAYYSGGGIVSAGYGTVTTLTNSTVSGNVASLGGGGGILSAGGFVTLTNSTVSGNRADDHGGGIYNDAGTLTLAQSTITNNTADRFASGFGDGGGIASDAGAFNLVNLKDTIVAGNFDLSSLNVEPDCYGTLTSQGYNFIQTVSPYCTITGDATGNITGQGANLAALADNGGPTQTHAILADSPAIDAGSPDCPPPATDQRGVGRPLGSGCDIGAYESSFVSTPTASAQPSPTTPGISPTPSPTATSIGQTPTPVQTATSIGPTPTVSSSPSPTLAATPTPTGTPTEGAIQGDADCDGDVDLGDAIVLLEDAAETPGGSPCNSLRISGGVADNRDVDCDGDVTALDALNVMLHLADLPEIAKPLNCAPVGQPV